MGISAAPAITCTMHIASQLFPPFGSSALFALLRFRRHECGHKKRPLARWGWRTPLSMPYHLDAGGKRRCSPVRLAAFSGPYSNLREICQCLFLFRVLRALRGRWRISPRITIEIRSCHRTFSCLASPIPCTYELYARKNCRQDILRFNWSSLDESLGD